MFSACLSVWGDSIAKGVVFDEARGRYAVCRDSCLQLIKREGGVAVENHAVMGQTSQDGLARMQPEALKPGEITVIEYGGNDCDLDWRAVAEHPDVLQYGKVPVEQFSRNLEEMVDRVRAADAEPVLVTPPPLVAHRYFDWVSRGLNADNILKYLGDVEAIFRWQENYANHVAALAERLSVKLVDIRSRMLAGDTEELVCVDGIHPNERGHRVIYEAVAPLLQ